MEMKKNLFFSTLLLVTAVLMGGCRQEEPKTAPPTLSIEPAEALVFEATGGTRVIAVTTNQDTWRVLPTRRGVSRRQRMMRASR